MSDIRLHWTERGQGAPLILLHGNGEDGGYFENQLAHFSKNRRVIAPDTRGHGQSPRGSAPFTIRQFADDLRLFMDALSIRQADILGFSDGGNIAMIFAMKYPDRVGKLILNGANLYARGVKPSVQIPIEIGYRVARLLAHWQPAARRRAEMLGLMVRDPNLRPSELSQIRAHTLVVAGDHDMIRDGHTRLIARSLPHAELAILPGGHFIARDNPEDFNRTVEAFLNAR